MDQLTGGEAEFGETDFRVYERAACATFRKTSEAWGGYSNMAGGFPLVVNEVAVNTTEALYQACRFPHLPAVQREIIAQASPMAAKMKGKPHRKYSRPNFDAVRVSIMWWALRVKLALHPRTFGRLLLDSGDRPIVEDSHMDTFWGAKATGEITLAGQNVLGRLLALLRERFRMTGAEGMREVEPPPVSDFLLYGQPIRVLVGK